MFTGLIQSVGTLKQISARGNYRILTIESSLADVTMEVGESISCDGACLTVTGFDASSFEAEVSQETISKTIISSYRVGSRINIERAVKAGDRLGGHIVNGHVDGTARVDYQKPVGQSIEFAVAFDRKYDAWVVAKGSVALNGVSLTINEVKPGWLSVNIIPHTAELTNLKQLKKGDRVNIEFDIIGKYVSKMIQKDKPGGLTREKLKESGW
ncbi:MAG: riboflavin synthase [Candidatus Zixiibacteriota bacterium]|nr:MAG: riboflavin synthase [candidate division Zixibacteria bacterium]